MTRQPPWARLIAFYHPRYYPCPEADRWWGTGGTDWRGVVAARPLFTGHAQPRLPADLGLYDQRVPEVRAAQAELAADYGIGAFCYWHYWFDGRRPFGLPFDEVLASGEPRLPFCLAWANESWYRPRWPGRPELLQEQTYSAQDDARHAHWLVGAFADPRYLRVGGRPVFLVSRPDSLPDPRRTTDAIRDACARAGLPEPYLIGCAAGPRPPRARGFDAALDFQPRLALLPGAFTFRGARNDRLSLAKYLRNRKLGIFNLRVKIYDDAQARAAMAAPAPGPATYPCTFVGWDDTPIWGPDGIALVNGGPENFGRDLARAAGSVLDRPADERLVFVNAWNGWAEGSCLEPDRQGGRRFLEAVRDVAWPAGPAAPPPATPRRDEGRVETRRARVIALYLPQFHPIPENDAWWGQGFTEWTNVSRALPSFAGHYQPHVPADLGYYDLRLAETRQAQTELAEKNGIYGFCYYHYWFHGRRLLERPFQEVLDSGRPRLPFCLCWANENWTRRWDGAEQELLIKQEYSAEDDRRHARWLLGAFADERYIRVNGRPLFLVYRAGLLPDARRTTDVWREEAHRAGVPEPYLCRVESNFPGERLDPAATGFDAAVEFQPDGLAPLRLLGRAGEKVESAYHENLVLDYAEFARSMMWKDEPPYRRYPAVMVSWDNTARRKSGAFVMVGSTPELYETWLESAVARTADWPTEERVVFVNAWNEWAEGTHLEPDVRFGHGYLEATRRVVLGGPR